MNIYVSNLSFNAYEEDLKELFTPHGEVTSAKIINDRTTGKSRGFAFVEMANDTEATAAIASVNGQTLDGRTIQVTQARPKENSGSSGGGFKSKSPFKSNW